MSSSQAINVHLGWFWLMYNAAELNISSFRSEVMVLIQKRVKCSIWVGLSLSLKHLVVLATSDDRMQHKMK